MPFDNPIGVIDVGSNSGRLVVYRAEAGGYIELLEDTKAPLRLARDLQQGDGLSEAAMERTVAALRDFQSIATAAGARRLIVVGTSAMREAANGAALIERIRQKLGITVGIIDGLAEARYSFLGAIHSLPVEHGYVLDIGGGSLELVHFRDRQALDARMLPLGSLRLATRFLTSDPPTDEEVEQLRSHVKAVLDEALIPRAAEDELLIGTGGTVRNLAKIDQRRQRYPIERLHGSRLSLESVARMSAEFSSMTMAQRRQVPGLSADRLDSIVGGAIAIQVVMEQLGAGTLLVSGQGLREGIAYAALDSATPSPEDVRRASISALTQRFRTWDAARAGRRTRLATDLAAQLQPELPPLQRELLRTAATVLDIGRSIDYYNRFAHAASIVLEADLGGFSHHDLAFLSAIISTAEKGKRPDIFGAVLTPGELEGAARLALLLALADEFERHLPPGEAPTLTAEVGPEQVVLPAPPLTRDKAAKLAERFRRSYGTALCFRDWQGQGQEQGEEGVADELPEE